MQHCLFNSFSTPLAGDESRSTELIYRCCVELIINNSKILRHLLYPRFELISPEFNKDCLRCAKPGTYSSVRRLIALSNLPNVPIQSVYPSLNGSKHRAFQDLNQKFRPPFVDPEKGTITVMWTSTTAPELNHGSTKTKSKREWFPNHFVPLVDEERKYIDYVSKAAKLSEEKDKSTSKSADATSSTDICIETSPISHQIDSIALLTLRMMTISNEEAAQLDHSDVLSYNNDNSQKVALLDRSD